MKSIKISALALALMLVSAPACKDFLDIKPVLDLDEESALQSTEGLETAIVGSYRQASGIYGRAKGMADMLLGGEQLSTTGVALDFARSQINSRTMDIFNGDGRSMWNDTYVTINRVNKVLEAEPKVKDQFIAANRNRLKGEALFLRATTMFELSRLLANPWGHTADNSHPGVIIKTEPSTGTSEKNVPRASLKQTYDQIIKDLTEAASLLPASNGPGRATKWSAHAYLARIYFQQNDFTNARTQANLVLGNTAFKLMEKYEEAFSKEDNTEAVFQIASSPGVDPAGFPRGVFSVVANTAGAWHIKPAFVDLFANNDKRKELIKEFDKNKNFYSAKWDANLNRLHMPVIRLAEILLIRAESNVQLNGAIAEIRSDINAIRQRAGLAADNATSGRDALLALIAEERARELAFEGDRLQYLRRLGAQGRISTIDGLPWNSCKFLFEIPDDEQLYNNQIQLNRKTCQ